MHFGIFLWLQARVFFLFKHGWTTISFVINKVVKIFFYKITAADMHYKFPNIFVGTHTQPLYCVLPITRVTTYCHFLNTRWLQPPLMGGHHISSSIVSRDKEFGKYKTRLAETMLTLKWVFSCHFYFYKNVQVVKNLFPSYGFAQTLKK